jgi:hypothetical protein
MPMDEIESLYSEEQSGSNAEAAAAEANESESIDQEEASGNTAIIPNNVLRPDGSPLKEGDTITVTVVKNYGDESEVKVQASASPKAVTPPPGSMEEANAELETMGAQ